uniref:Fibronectin type-III domain-containing protein n=1 Tax=Fibrocapsa japonica TaxID=94617 RepID=A0A7S2V2W8_9STRA|mmetsp:Transcript_4788/g.7169  ORF Transcript_4788/g.7169 Transcript_4788/m.7169 type:complete len:270 (+) Transcript_4788:99-908(+)
MSTWRLLLFRALKDGDLDKVKNITETRPFAIHEAFTQQMQAWELEWDSLRWFEFLEATCLYIACSYSRKSIVEWLVENGVDRTVKGYCRQTAADVIGQCRRDREAELEIERILKQPVEPPRSPPAPNCEVKVVYENVVKKMFQDARTDNMSDLSDHMPVRVTESVPRCKLVVNWSCFWLSPSTTYELTYRRLTKFDKREPQWVSEELQTSMKTLTGLQPNATYELKVRAQNSAGWGEYSGISSVHMPNPRTPKTQKSFGNLVMKSKDYK